MAADEDELVLLDRTARATRGKRMTKLLDEELEQDEMFWNQEALKDEDNDDNYQEEAEAPDLYDSDFDEDEPDPDEEGETVVEERLPVKKRLIFPGKQMRKMKSNKSKSKNKATKKKDLSVLEKEEETSKADEVPKGGKPDSTGVEEQEVEKSVRKSTRTSVIVRQAEREAIRAELQATMKPIKRKKQGEEKRMTQEEMLLEAAETEIMNLRNLERVLAREEEVKKKAVTHKDNYDGPQIRFFRKMGILTWNFSREQPLDPEKSVCVVTGLPAKYKDPKTGLPYATLEAFKIIRARFEESERIKKAGDLEMGGLFDSISGDGFTTKHKRSGHASANNSRPDNRLGARFRRIPALDMLDSD